MKNLFLISGLNIQYTAADPEYADMRVALAATGYKVIPFGRTWRRTNPTDFANEFKEFYAKYKSKEGNIVVGNSFGAVVTLITALDLKPDMIVLCSLSPFFREDRNKDWPTADHMRRLGKRRLKDISQYSVKALANGLNDSEIAVKILYGEIEKSYLTVLVARSKNLSKLLPKADLVEVPNAPHSFRQPEYWQGIVKVLK